MPIVRKQRARERKAAGKLAYFSSRVKDQAALDKLLDGTSPLERREMIEMLKEHLPFVPAELSLDCPECGRYRGQVVPHSCT